MTSEKKYIKIKINISEFKDIKNVEEFYRNTYIDELIKSSIVTDTAQILISNKDRLELRNYILENAIGNGKKNFSDEAKKSIAKTEWLFYSPCVSDEVPPGEIWIREKMK